jgi:hypothetical protein
LLLKAIRQKREKNVEQISADICSTFNSI